MSRAIPEIMIGATAHNFAATRIKRQRVRTTVDHIRKRKLTVQSGCRNRQEWGQAKHNHEIRNKHHASPADRLRKLAQRKLAGLESLPSDGELGSDRQDVSHVGADGCGARPGIEHDARAHGRGAEDDPGNQQENQRSEGDLGSRVIPIELLRQGNDIVARHGIKQTRSTGKSGCQAEHARKEDQEHQHEAPILSRCLNKERADTLRVGRCQQSLEVHGAEAKHEDLSKPKDCRDDHGVDDRLGRGCLGTLGFFGNVSRTVVANQGPHRHQGSKNHGSAVRLPASEIGDLRENDGSRVFNGRGDRQPDHDGQPSHNVGNSADPKSPSDDGVVDNIEYEAECKEGHFNSESNVRIHEKGASFGRSCKVGYIDLDGGDKEARDCVGNAGEHGNGVGQVKVGGEPTKRRTMPVTTELATPKVQTA